MADNELHCNNLKCRALVATDGKAVVTNCSHIFCVTCANALFTTAKVCPACETSLTETDDIVICSLNPTTEYKSSILSGLSPSVILEIASRALSFWTYQTSQEGAYQTIILKNAQDRLLALERQLSNASGELQSASAKIAALEAELDAASRRNQDLIEQQRAKEREYSKLKQMHDKLKRQIPLGAKPGENGMLDAQHTGSTGGMAFGGGNGGMGPPMMPHRLAVPPPVVYREHDRRESYGAKQARPPTTPSGAPQAFFPSRKQTGPTGDYAPRGFGGGEAHQRFPAGKQAEQYGVATPSASEASFGRPQRRPLGVISANGNTGYGGGDFGNGRGAHGEKGRGVLRAAPDAQPRRYVM